MNNYMFCLKRSKVISSGGGTRGLLKLIDWLSWLQIHYFVICMRAVFLLRYSSSVSVSSDRA